MPEASAPAKPRLTTGQMLQLMRLETEKALRHDYAISCMVVGLDGFERPDDLPRRKELMPSIFRGLKEVTFEEDVRGLGVYTERYQLAVFPYVTPERLAQLAESLLGKARGLTPDAADGEAGVTLSIGISHNLHAGSKSFESLVEEAELGMGLAHETGGDRFMQALEVETEIDRLKEALEVQIAEIQEQQDSFFGDLDVTEENWGRNLVDRVLDAFRGEPENTAGILRLEKAVIEIIREEVHRWRSSSSVTQMLESQRQVQLLERRVHKLTESLGVTEEELRRIASMKNIDLGVSSIYRTVQGLDAGGEGAEQKAEMLKNLFEANLSLREELATK